MNYLLRKVRRVPDLFRKACNTTNCFCPELPLLVVLIRAMSINRMCTICFVTCKRQFASRVLCTLLFAWFLWCKFFQNAAETDKVGGMAWRRFFYGGLSTNKGLVWTLSFFFVSYKYVYKYVSNTLLLILDSMGKPKSIPVIPAVFQFALEKKFQEFLQLPIWSLNFELFSKGLAFFANLELLQFRS